MQLPTEGPSGPTTILCLSGPIPSVASLTHSIPASMVLNRLQMSCVRILTIFFFCLSLLWPLSLRSTGSGRAGSAAMAHGPSRSAACGLLPDRGTNPCPLHWQADSQPLRHLGSPASFYIGAEPALPIILLRKSGRSRVGAAL